MTEKKKDVTTHDTWGDLGQKNTAKPATMPKSAAPPPTPPKRERHITNPMLVERPSTKMLVVGELPEPKFPASRPMPRSKTSTLMGVPYTPPVAPPTAPQRISKTFKRPSFDSVPPSSPLVDLSDLFPDAPRLEAPKPIVVPTMWQKFLSLLRRLRILR